MALRQTSLTRVTTPYYIAPEGILVKDLYSTSVDIWALGCIVAEMLKRHPLFEGRDRKHQLQLIVDFCGKPEDEELKEYPESTKKQFLNSYQACCSSSIEELFPRGIDDMALDFLKKLLVFKPSKRYTAVQCYEHPYLSPLNTGVYKEYVNSDIVLDDMEYAYETPEEEWRFRLWKEINHYQRLRPLDQPSE
uniref:Protein kinase domain-containing protein n=1 Tax=Arcella intermedia TaxID=1963864 RepID=A0A6B2LKI1_9EUKA|eukprot:TRINITY_DN3127_c0_g3_i1.p2 TRINITY_DN3127_c0_g3~~TRINITY_DN3127_c0_g3_i1.p2  ORF type:complete len:192 (-),score=25.45 TRINITY_DN3127_c0_g3_i1:174-749(-)